MITLHCVGVDREACINVSNVQQSHTWPLGERKGEEFCESSCHSGQFETLDLSSSVKARPKAVVEMPYSPSTLECIAHRQMLIGHESLPGSGKAQPYPCPKLLPSEVPHENELDNGDACDEEMVHLAVVAKISVVENSILDMFNILQQGSASGESEGGDMTWVRTDLVWNTASVILGTSFPACYL